MRWGSDLSRRHWLRLCVAGAWPAGSACAIASGTSLSDALQALQADPRAPLAGLSVLVMRAGQVVFEGQWGQRFIDLEDERRSLPVTADTLFRMASVSKLFVALGVMRLVEAGRLELDGDAGHWLGLRLRNPHFPDTPITPRLLLGHRSSLRDEGGYIVEPGQALQDLLLPGGALHGAGRCWAAPSPGIDMRPGAYFSYCNLNFGVLGSVIERASGQRFDRFMHEQVLAPLGMSGGFDPSTFSDAQLAQVATLYRKAPDENGPWDPRGPWLPQADDWRGRRPAPLPGLDGYALGRNGSLFGPQGRLRTRVRDLACAMRMLAGGGMLDGRRFLSAASVQALLTEHWRLDEAERNGNPREGEPAGPGPFQAWGLGLQHFVDRRREAPRGTAWGDRLVPAGGVTAWGHLGSAYGLQSALMLDPARGHGVAYAINGTGADPDASPGAYSSFPPWEERVLALLWSEALRAD